MREIKFRAWDTKNNYMEDSWNLDKCISFEDNKIVSSNGEILMQYTGLKDVNGEEIYEGDIIKEQYYHNIRVIGFEISSEPKTRGQGDFTPITNAGYFYDGKYCEIIGNIYENPELLRQKEKRC